MQPREESAVVLSISRNAGDFTAVDDFVSQGCQGRSQFLGPNGAGKSWRHPLRTARPTSGRA